MNKDIRKHIQYVTSQDYIVERYPNCKTYFKESTHIDFDQLGFKDSTWYNDECPSFALDGEGCESVQCFIGEDTWEYLEDGLHRYELYIDDDCVYSSMELPEMYGFIKSNLDLFKSLANGDEQKREIVEQKLELEHSITILEEIKERLHSEIFYDSNWVEGDGYDQSDFIIGVDIAINKLKKERK